jgi:hypothetical protein
MFIISLLTGLLFGVGLATMYCYMTKKTVGPDSNDIRKWVFKEHDPLSGNDRHYKYDIQIVAGLHKL